MNANDNPVKDIGPKLKKVRFDRGLTLDNVAEMTGVSKTMLGQIERGESSPTVATLWKLAGGLHHLSRELLAAVMVHAGKAPRLHNQKYNQCDGNQQ